MGVRSFRGSKEKWLWGIVTKVCGPRIYVVNVARAHRYVHVDHMISVNARSTDNVTLPVIPKPHPKIFGIKGCSDQLWIK